MVKPFDPVSRPQHYTSASIECIEAIAAQLSPDEYRGFLKGNVCKYLWREKQKGGLQSLKKAEWYLDRLIAFEEALVTPVESPIRMDQETIGTSFYEKAKQTAIPDA